MSNTYLGERRAELIARELADHTKEDPAMAEGYAEKLAGIIAQLQSIVDKHAFFDDLQENDPLVLPPVHLNPEDPRELVLLWLHRSEGRRIPIYLLEDEDAALSSLVVSADLRVLTSDGINAPVLSIWTNGYGIEDPCGKPITDLADLDGIAQDFQRYADALDTEA